MSQLTNDTGMTSASGVFDNNHDYSEDDGDDYFPTGISAKGQDAPGVFLGEDK